MNTLGDALKDAFGSDELRARGHSRSPHRTIAAIRRRRMVHAAGTGSAAAVVVAAVAYGATAIPGLRTAQSAMPGVTCIAYPLALANPTAFGALEYVGRSYIDDGGEDYVFMHADGTAEELALGADGAVRVVIDGEEVVLWAESMSSRPGRHVMDWVRDADGVQGVGAPLDPDAPQPNTWAWNVELPDDAPEGVNEERLSWLLLYSMRGSGGSLDAGDVPEGATVEMAAHGEGNTWTVPVRPGYPGPGPEQVGDAVTSLDLVVTLPDGGTYTITAHHDPNAVGPQICATPGPDPSVSPSQVEPTSSEPSSAPTSEPGTPLAGPEAEVFACGAPLPPGLEGTLGLDVTWETGNLHLGDTKPNDFDFGSGGVMAQGELAEGGPPLGELEAANWSTSTGDAQSLAVFGAVVAVKNDVVVGIVSAPQETPLHDAVAFGGDSAGGSERFAWYISNVDARMVPCPEFEVGDLGGAERAVLLGTGAVGGPYTFAWTSVGP